MAEGEIAAAVEGLAKDAAEAGRKIADSVGKFAEDSAANAERTVDDAVQTEDRITKSLNDIRPDAPPTETAGQSTITSKLGPADQGATTPSSAIRNPDGVPGASLGAKRLGTLDESQVTRDENGLITDVQGQPVKDYANALGAERRGVYRAAKEDQSLPRKQQGNSMSVGIDRRTGNVYEGTNGAADDVIDEDDLHPTLQRNLDALRANGPYSHGDGAPSHEFPHRDDPLGHGEVKGTNQALWDRHAQGLPDGPEALPEIIQSPQFPFLHGGGPAPFCANCNSMLDGVGSATGRHDAYPPTDATLRP